MNKEHFIRHSRLYGMLRAYTAFGYSLFYREICVINKENIPDNEPVIFAPNHQNALMDALAIICTVKKQPVFMARADMFKNKFTSGVLNFLKIIPVYRIRDGIDNLSNNDESFTMAQEVLHNRKCVGIMPEGNHGDQRRLRPLKKGLARFALQVQSSFGKSNSLKIIPVGIAYSHYVRFRSKILVIYGQPIDVSDFKDVYALSPQKAIHLLQERLAEEMKSYMLNIDSDIYYQLICKLSGIYLHTLQHRLEAGDSFYEQFQVEKIISDKLVNLLKTNGESLAQLEPLVREYSDLQKRLQLNEAVIDMQPVSWKNRNFNVIRYTAFLFFAFLGIAIHFIPAILIKFISGRVKDLQFQSSAMFVSGLFIIPIFYLFILAIPVPVYTKILILFISPVLGVLSYDYIHSLRKHWRRWQYDQLYKSNNVELTRMLEIRRRIIQKLDQLI